MLSGVYVMPLFLPQLLTAALAGPISKCNYLSFGEPAVPPAKADVGLGNQCKKWDT